LVGQSSVDLHCTQVFVVVLQTPVPPVVRQSPSTRHPTQRPDVVSQTGVNVRPVLQLMAVHFAWQVCVVVAQTWSVAQSLVARHCTQACRVVSHTPMFVPQSFVDRHPTQVPVEVSQTPPGAAPPPAGAVAQSAVFRHCTQRPEFVSHKVPPKRLAMQLMAVHVVTQV